MEISKELEEMMNDQLNFEIYSAYIYLGMAAYFEDLNLGGMAHWMELQFFEEFNHAMRFYRHIFERGGRVDLREIKKPQKDYASIIDAWETAYEHEKLVTSRIYKIGELAEKEGDRAALTMLNWFYTEQVEEEEKTMTIRDKLKFIGDNIPGLYHLDQELGARPPVTPPPAESFAP
ncbi:MAG: ferritin [Candidatus Thorarchaeota archaeon SMTZ1-83]